MTDIVKTGSTDIGASLATVKNDLVTNANRSRQCEADLEKLNTGLTKLSTEKEKYVKIMNDLLAAEKGTFAAGNLNESMAAVTVQNRWLGLGMDKDLSEKDTTIKDVIEGVSARGAMQKPVQSPAAVNETSSAPKKSLTRK